MRFFGLIFFSLICFSLEGSIHQIESLIEIHPTDTQTLYLLDIDDTLIDFPYSLGSKSWRKYIKTVSRKYGENHWHDQLSLHLAKNYPISTVEPITSSWVKSLQSAGHLVIGFTARERSYWYDTPTDNIDQLTINQLKAVQITLDKERLEKLFDRLINVPEYYEGVFFENLGCKGKFLKNLLLTTSTYPQKIIFVDDVLKHVEAVDRVLNELNIEHVCYWYKAYKIKEKCFDPRVADLQLYHFLMHQKILTDHEAMLEVVRFSDFGPPDFQILLDKITETKNGKQKAVPSKKNNPLCAKAHQSFQSKIAD